MTEHIPFLIAAYAVVWIGVLLYVAALARRSRNLERDIEELRQLTTKTPRHQENQYR
jgi:CcmD family protein